MYRQIETATWDDPWFAELDTDAKLLFLYLLTNRRTTAAGVFETSPRLISFETGLDTQRLDTAMDALSSRIRWWPDHQVIWVRNFLRHQAISPNFYKSAWVEMLTMPEEIRHTVGDAYPILTHPEPLPDSKKELETLMEGYRKGSQRVSNTSRKTRLEEKSTDIGADAPSTSAPNYTDDFLAFWQAFPRGKGNKKKSFDQWKRLRPDADLRAVILDRLEAWKQTRQWREGFVTHAERWLRDRGWEDDLPEDAPAGLRVVDNPYAGRGYDPMRSMTPEEKAEYERQLAQAQAEYERKWGTA